MGKKRIKTIDLSQKEDKTKKKGLLQKEAGGKIVSSGKQHGRIADMGTVMLEEMEKRQKTEKKSEIKKKPSLHKKAQAKKTRSHRYQTLKKMIKADQTYSLAEAVKLLRKTASAKFKETIELHLIVSQPGNLTKTIKTEKKAPLAHIKVGKADLSEKQLEEKVQTLMKSIGADKIQKAVLTSTMGPAIKVNIN